MKIRQQHYVWRHYLEAWEINGQLHTLREGLTFKTSAANVAKKRDFYRLRPLTPAQIQLVRRLGIEPAPPLLRDVHEGLLNTFSKLPLLHRLVQSLPEGHEARRLADEAIINTEEYLQSAIERGGANHLRDLRGMDARFFDSADGAADFLYFLCSQYLRTRNIQKRIAAALRGSSRSDVAAAAHDVEQIWPVLRHIFAVNSSFSLFNDRSNYRIVLLAAPGNLRLITGDQPVVNARGDPTTLTPPLEFEPYYPISPALGMLLTARDIHPECRAVMSDDEVAAYNNLIYKAADEMIFADCEEALKPYR